MNYLAQSNQDVAVPPTEQQRVRIDLFKPHSGEWIASGVARLGAGVAGAAHFLEILASQDAAPAAAFEHFDVVVSTLTHPAGLAVARSAPSFVALYRQETYACRWAEALTKLGVPRFSGPGVRLLATAEATDVEAQQTPRMRRG